MEYFVKLLIVCVTGTSVLVCSMVCALCNGEPSVLTVGYNALSIALNGYQPNMSCQWSVTSRVPGAVILMQVKNRKMGCGDFLNAYNGNSTSGINFLQNECSLECDIACNLNSEIRLVDSSELFITFSSDGNNPVPEGGFEILVISGKSHGSCGNNTFNANSTTQYITSPGFPNRYPLLIDCEYRIYPENPFANISVKFHFIDIMPSLRCIYDFVSINGEKHCKTKAWFPKFETEDNMIVIKFHSDANIELRGFVLSFTQLQVNGSWGEWSNFTDCSVSCGGGTMYRTRTCDSPPPTLDGCTGNNSEEKTCNTQPCTDHGSQDCTRKKKRISSRYSYGRPATGYGRPSTGYGRPATVYGPG